MINVYGTLLNKNVVPAVQQHSGIGWFYMVGFILLVFRFLYALYKIGILHQKTKILHFNGLRVVLTGNVFQPFSFMNTVFVPESFRENDGFQSILSHESVHVKQKHTFDLILLELLLPVQWFNPFAWLLRKAIRENHEFLADRAVLDAGFPVSEYQKMLLYQVMGTKFDLGTGFGYSLTKKRFKMMKTQVNKKSLLLSSTLTVLLFSGILFVAATELSADNLINPGNSETQVQIEKIPLDQDDGKVVFTVVEQMPEYPGGIKALQEYLSENIEYPKEAMKNGIQGKVFVGFVVNTKGKIVDIKIARSVDPLLDKEALRVVKAMQDWTPGKQRGKKVNVAFTLPINFALNSQDAPIEGAKPSPSKMLIQDKSFKKSGTGIEVSATVLDHNNQPLPGASVVIKGTTKGTVSDKNGRFSIKLDNPNQTVVVSYVGKQTVVMYPGSGEDEIVVIAHNSGNKNKAEKPSEISPDVVFQIVEEMPKFPGGEEAMMKYLSENITYPTLALKDTIQGKVFVNYIVEKDGTVSNAKIVRSAHPLLDQEALRVVNAMPDWIPGKQRGEAVRVNFMLPINFALN